MACRLRKCFHLRLERTVRPPVATRTLAPRQVSWRGRCISGMKHLSCAGATRLRTSPNRRGRAPRSKKHIAVAFSLPVRVLCGPLPMLLAPISCSLHVTRGRRRSMQRFYSGSRQPLDTSWCVCFVSSSGVRLIMPALHFRHHDYRRTRCAPSRDAARGSPQSNIEAVSVMPCGGTPRGTPHRWRSCRWGY